MLLDGSLDKLLMIEIDLSMQYFRNYLLASSLATMMFDGTLIIKLRK